MRGLQGGWQGGRMRAYAAPGAVVAERGTASEAQDYGEWGLYTIILCSMLYLSKFRHRKLESVRRTIPVEPPKPIRKPTIGMPEDISNHFNGERVYSDRRIYIDHLTDSVTGMSEDVHEHHM